MGLGHWLLTNGMVGRLGVLGGAGRSGLLVFCSVTGFATGALAFRDMVAAGETAAVGDATSSPGLAATSVVSFVSTVPIGDA